MSWLVFFTPLAAQEFVVEDELAERRESGASVEGVESVESVENSLQRTLESQEINDNSESVEEGSVSLNFQDIAVRRALQILADVSDFSLVVGDSVEGNITMRLDNVSWQQALDLVLRARGLDKRLVGKVLYVAPMDEIGANELRALENQQQVAMLAPLVTEYIEVKYAVAADIRDLLMGQNEVGSGDGGTAEIAEIGGEDIFVSSKILSSRGSATVDERTNTLILQDVADKIAEVRELIGILDVPVRQVLIEARIVNANINFSRELGVRWGGLHKVAGMADTFLLGGSLDSTTAAIAGSGGLEPGMQELIDALVFPDALAVDLGVENPAASFSLGYAGAGSLLQLELSALEASGNGEVIARPKVMTQDKQLAVIQSGVQVPYQAQAGGTAGGSTTEFIPALLSLEVTPHITPDKRIIMALDIHQDSVVTGSGATPAISTNSVSTRVLVDNGSTIVLGGVFREEVTTSVAKAPVLGDLPVIGNLFRHTEDQQTKTELLIFITPSILGELM